MQEVCKGDTRLVTKKLSTVPKDFVELHNFMSGMYFRKTTLFTSSLSILFTSSLFILNLIAQNVMRILHIYKTVTLLSTNCKTMLKLFYYLTECVLCAGQRWTKKWDLGTRTYHWKLRWRICLRHYEPWENCKIQLFERDTGDNWWIVLRYRWKSQSGCSIYFFTIQTHAT